MINGPLWRLYNFYGQVWWYIQIWWHTNSGVLNRLVFLVRCSIPFCWNASSWKKWVLLVPIGTQFQNTKGIGREMFFLRYPCWKCTHPGNHHYTVAVTNNEMPRTFVHEHTRAPSPHLVVGRSSSINKIKYSVLDFTTSSFATSHYVMEEYNCTQPKDTQKAVFVSNL